MGRTTAFLDNRWVVLGLLLLSLVILPAQIITPGGVSLHFSVTGSYADPRDFPTTPGVPVCGNTNTNDATHDDSPAINLALAYFPVVHLPVGCKMVTSVFMTADGQRITGTASGSNYSSPTVKQPGDIYVPDAASTGSATSNCMIDTKGYDGITFDHFGFYGQYAGDGTVAFCDSVGIGNGAAQAFTHFSYISVGNMGNGIGTAMSQGTAFSGCLPTGFLGNPVFQFRGEHLSFFNDCSGITANYSDVYLQNIFFGNIQGTAIASAANGDGIGSIFTDGRCEYNFPSFGFPNDGACIYIDGKFNTFANWIFDHPYGQCMSLGVGDNGTNASFTTLINIGCQSSNQGAQFSEITNVCNFVFQSAVDVSAYSMRMSNDPAALYGLCFVGTSSFTLHWDQPENDVGAGWTTAFLHGTFPLGSTIWVNSVAYITNDRVPWSAVLLAQPTTLNASSLPLDITSVAVPCNAGTLGQEYSVSNALAPVLGSAVAQGGTAWAKIDCNGTSWNVSAK